MNVFCKETHMAALAGLMVAISGCGGSSSSPAPSCDVPALFTDKCGGAACHGPDNPAAELDLVSIGVDQRVANQPAGQCLGLLADPSNPTGSVLYQKVADMPTCGGRMPLSAEPLDEQELTCIRDWISGLLPPQAAEPDAGADCPECACVPNQIESCYNGPPGTVAVGLCVGGTRQCAADGLSWGPCEGEILPVGEDCNTIEDESCDGATPVCSDDWSLGFGSFFAQDATDMKVTQVARSVATDSAGNVIMTGDFEGTVSFGGAYLTATELKSDIVLAKYDRHGNHVFSKRFGDSSNQFATQVMVDGDDNIIVTGRMLGGMTFGGPEDEMRKQGYFDVFVAKLDPLGNHLWSWHSRGDNEERADRIAIDSAGDIFLTGMFNDTIRFGATTLTATVGPDGVTKTLDAFVAKLDGETGQPVFAVQIGGEGNDYGYGIDVGSAGKIFVTGYFGEDITIGDDTLTSRGGKDIFFARLSSAGEVDWARSFGSTGDDQPYDLRLGPDGSPVLVGTSSGSIDFGGGSRAGFGLRDMFLAKFSQAGNHVFSSIHGDAGDQFALATFEDNTAFALDIDTQNNIYVAGPLLGTLRFDGGQSLSSSPADKSDIFFAKLSPTGSFITGRRFGRTGTDIGLDVVGLGETVVLAGRHYSSSLDFGASGTITGYGSSDGFVVKLRLP